MCVWTLGLALGLHATWIQTHMNRRGKKKQKKTNQTNIQTNNKNQQQ